jgi:hypothetical protein
MKKLLNDLTTTGKLKKIGIESMATDVRKTGYNSGLAQWLVYFSKSEMCPNRNFNIFTINNLTTRHCAKPRNVRRQLTSERRIQ